MGLKVRKRHPRPLKKRMRIVLPSLFAMVYPSMREAAIKHGYALSLHGSMNRDFDVIACPWTEKASTPAAVVEAIRVVLDAMTVNHEGDRNPEKKPHGRLAWSLHLIGSGTYIDLSVMPKCSHD